MKKLNIIALLLILLATACKKDTVEHKATASFNVINAVVGLGAVRVNPDAGPRFFYSKANDLGYGAGAFYQTFMGSRNIKIVSSADTTKAIFSRAVNFKQTVNSLYLIGTSAAVDTMFRAETIPVIQTYAADPDNSGYIRFVNLSPNSTPLNIKIASSGSNEASALAYKGITDFNKYEAKTTTANYVFEVWNTANTNKLASITLTPASIRFKTISLIIRGIMADPLPTPAIPNQLSLFQVIYF